jgi:hypothetical protein
MTIWILLTVVLVLFGHCEGEDEGKVECEIGLNGERPVEYRDS